MAPNPLLELGAGLSSKTVQNHPSGPPQHGPIGQGERGFAAASTFMSGIMAISATQFLGAPLKLIDPKFYDAYMAFTKQSFGVLITTMTQWWSPTVVRVSGDTSIPKQLFHKPDGTLECRFPKRLVMMANHQLYTDWLYLWWVAYTNNMHGYIYIILKESLKNIPVIGWGAQFYNFIFLSRKWEQDQASFRQHLGELNNADDPMWLLIFPEGTNLAKGTREKSKQWAEKTGVKDMKHQLLPRSRGLQFCLQNLRTTTDWLYDVTIGYEGIPPEEFGQDIFTLRSSMFEGRPPKSVNMHFRRFKIADIPIDDDKAFDLWLRNRWREKDYLLEHFVKYDRFPEDEQWLFKQKAAKKTGPMNAKFIETQIKTNNLEEFLSIFAPLSSIMMVMNLFYGGQNPEDLLKMIGEAAQQQQPLSLVRDDASTKNPLRLEKAKGNSSSSMPSVASLQGMQANMTPSAAQRNLLQQYIAAVKPSVQKALSLPDTTQVLKTNVPIRTAQSAAGAPRKKIPLSTSTASVKSTPATPKTPTRPKAATSSTTSTSPSMKFRPAPIKKPTNSTTPAPSKSSIPPTKRNPSAPAKTIPQNKDTTVSNPLPLTATNLSKLPSSPPQKPTPITAPSKITQRAPQQPLSQPRTTLPKPAPNTPKAQPAQEIKNRITIPPTILQKMKAKNPETADSKTPGSRNVTIAPSILAKMKTNSGTADAKPEVRKNVTIDPGILAKMKAEKEKEKGKKGEGKKVTIDPAILARMKEARKV